MSSAVWKFDRTVEETINELRDILERDGGIRANDVKNEWVYRAQLVIEPAGWEALWKLPQQTCVKFNVRPPCVVFVMVNFIDVESTLDAQVEVIGVQDDSISLPQFHTIPLEQLWPLKNQSNSAIEIKNTAVFIDLYRYFYSYIWLPWEFDHDDPANVCWFSEHVPSRCKLWANVYSGKGCSPVVVKSLLQEAEDVKEKIRNLEEELVSDTDDNDIDYNSGNISKLATLHNQLDHLKLKWETLMNEAVKYHQLESGDYSTKSSQNIVVWTGGQLNHYIEFLKVAEEWLSKHKNVSSDVHINCAQSLKDSLINRLASGSLVVLCPGNHDLPPIDSWIHNECNIISPMKNSVLKCPEERATAIVSTDNLSLTNITLDLSSTTTGFAVRGGRNDLTDCVMKGPGSKMAQGCVVYGKSQISFTNCVINDFFTGIVAFAGSEVILNSCKFENCDVAIQIYSGAKVEINNCHFEGYSESAIRFDNSQADAITKGDISLLQENNNVQIVNCKFSLCNKVNDVYITPYNECAFAEVEAK